MGSEGLLQSCARAPQPQALVSVVATGYPLGMLTRRVKMLAESLAGATKLSNLQVSVIAAELGELPAAFRFWTLACIRSCCRWLA
jgi:transposase-like protein